MASKELMANPNLNGDDIANPLAAQVGGMGADSMVGARGWARWLWQALVELVFPARCAACKCFGVLSAADTLPSSIDHGDDQAIGRYDPHAHLRGLLCPACLEQCQWLSSPLCTRCGIMFNSRVGGDHRCSDCLSANGYYGQARAVGVYQGALMALVHQLKYRGRVALAAPMGRMLQEAFNFYWRARRVDLVMPIPLHPRRLRRRGFNQAALLLRAWQRVADRDPAGAACPVAVIDTLVRARRTRSQTGLNRRERQRNMRGAFAVRNRNTIRNQRVLLLDDVFTTGATVEEAARTLLAAGAAVVDVFTFARTLR
ncbi:MAG: phosphoribosyltransferase family protein [Desulfobacterales bacterium]|jgi:ComF family protein